ncbi:MAG TPA: DUF2505 domain-containing protein [Nocardioidaceae bacterium]|nr:DUF2505 domain-containing protein [Nocardioidaceae bacterium]
MRFRHEQKYDAAPAQVHAMLADRAFRESVCRAQHARTAAVDVERSTEQMTVLVDQTRPSEGLPGFARKIVGDEIRVVQRETWSDSSAAALEVTIPGKPGRLQGTIALSGDAGRTVQAIDGELTVQVPLLGAKLESLISELLGEALEAEQEVGRRWLAGDR